MSQNNPAIFDAADGVYNFVGDAAVAGSVMINNFSSDALVYDLSSFIAAIGFDPFAG